MQKTCKADSPNNPLTMSLVYHKIEIIYRAYTIVQKDHVCNPKTCTIYTISFEISICFLYVDPQRIYKVCPLWLDVCVTHNGIGEQVKLDILML